MFRQSVAAGEIIPIETGTLQDGHAGHDSEVDADGTTPVTVTPHVTPQSGKTCSEMHAGSSNDACFPDELTSMVLSNEPTLFLRPRFPVTQSE